MYRDIRVDKRSSHHPHTCYFQVIEEKNGIRHNVKYTEKGKLATKNLNSFSYLTLNPIEIIWMKMILYLLNRRNSSESTQSKCKKIFLTGSFDQVLNWGRPKCQCPSLYVDKWERPSTGAQGVKMLSVCACVTLLIRTLKRSSTESKQGHKQECKYVDIKGHSFLH